MPLNIYDEAIYRIIKTAFKILALIPRKRITLWAGRIGRIWYRFDNRHRTIALDNLALAYGGGLGSLERHRFVETNFVNLIRVFLEIPHLRHMNKKNLHRFVTFKGREHIRSALQSGKAVVLLTAHMGNWEMMALAVSLNLDIEVGVVARPLDSPAADRILTEIRTSSGNRMINKSAGKDEISRLLRDGRMVGILLDQNASWYEGVYVPFFGHTACTNKGLALFALRYDVIVLPLYNHLLFDGRYEIVYERPLETIHTGQISDDVIANTALYNRILENIIRRAPADWFWVHRRWRLKAVPEKAHQRIKNLPRELVNN